MDWNSLCKPQTIKSFNILILSTSNIILQVACFYKLQMNLDNKLSRKWSFNHFIIPINCIELYICISSWVFKIILDNKICFVRENSYLLYYLDVKNFSLRLSNKKEWESLPTLKNTYKNLLTIQLENCT